MKNNLKKLEELNSAMEQVVSKSHEVLGNVYQSEITEKLYELMNEVKDMVEEAENK